MVKPPSPAKAENPVGRFGRGFARRLIVVEHRVDHRGALGRRIDDQIAGGVGRLVEEGMDFRLSRHPGLRGRTLFEA